jgi:Flp pilus assembly protein TadG
MSTPNNSRTRKTQKGSAVLESSLCFLLLFSVLYATMEFGRAVYSYNILAGATREASRYAVVHGSRSTSPATEADIRAEVERWAVGLNTTNLSVSATWTPGNTPGSRVRVSTTYTIAPITRLLLQAPIQVSARSQMMISQ